MEGLLTCLSQGQSYTEWLIFLTGLLYVVLAAKNNPQCWIWGIISCALLAWVSFVEYKLYADSFLQFLYVLVGFFGLYQWKFGRVSTRRSIRSLPLRQHLQILALGLITAAISGHLLRRYTDAFAGFADSMTTIFGILATILLVYKVRENWLYWIVIDILMAVLYFLRGGCLASALYLIFFLTAIYGWYRWTRIVQSQS